MSWSSVLGHDDWKAGFHRAAQRGRLAHGYLFVGASGIGKRLFAAQLAKTLLCESPNPDRWDSCDNCPACLLVDAKTHPDLFFVSRPEDKIEFPIAVIQQLCQDLALKPARGTRKIAIVDDADEFNEESANAFLKTLEEPPSGSMLILIGTSPDRQLPTIRSRCQIIPFAPLGLDAVQSVLQGREEVEGKDVKRLAQMSGGSPGLALEFAGSDLSKFRDRFLAELAAPKPDAYGLAREFQELVEDAGKEASSQRRRATLALSLLLDGLRQALESSTGVSGPAEAQRLASKFSTEQLMKRIRRCLEAEKHVERRVQLVLAIESLVDGLSA